MRAMTLAILTAAVPLAVLAPPGPATATAAAPADVPGVLCRASDGQDILSGAATRTTVLRERLGPRGSLRLTGLRLTYANGARCDVVTLDGRLPSGYDLRAFRASFTLRERLAVAGVDQGETTGLGIIGGRRGGPVRKLDGEVIGAFVYTTVETGTFPATPELPEAWHHQPYTFTHTRTTGRVTLRLRRHETKPFVVRWRGELPG